MFCSSVSRVGRWFWFVLNGRGVCADVGSRRFGKTLIKSFISPDRVRGCAHDAFARLLIPQCALEHSLAAIWVLAADHIRVIRCGPTVDRNSDLSGATTHSSLHTCRYHPSYPCGSKWLRGWTLVTVRRMPAVNIHNNEKPHAAVLYILQLAPML